MKTFIFFILVVLSPKIASAGCGVVSFKTTTGINLNLDDPNNNVSSAGINGADSLKLSFQQVGGCIISFVLTFENEVIYNYVGYGWGSINILQRSGSYKIVAQNAEFHGTYIFDLTGAAVGLNELFNLSQNLKVFPNPIVDRLRLSNTEEGIKNIKLYNSLGQK